MPLIAGSGSVSDTIPETEFEMFTVCSSNLEHESIIGSYNHLAPSSTICGKTKIEDNIFLGSNAVIVEKIKIAKNTIIGAGAVVTKSIVSSGGKFVGIPAKEI